MRPLLATMFISSSLLAACATQEPDELAGEADAEGISDGKGDTPDGAYTYFEVSTDMRECVYPACGGFHLDRLNAATTTCHDGTRAESCYTPELDWSQSGLSEAAQNQLRVAAGQSALDGVFAIVRGRFAASGRYEGMGRFIVTEAWVAEGEGVASGVFAKITQNGIRCAVAPCPTFTERGLNSSRRTDIAEVDFAAGELSDASIERLLEDSARPGGIIVAGDRFTFAGGRGKGRTATNAFRNLANAAASGGGACFKGGCSGQICSDDPFVISTCEWRAEYACYQQATCERQADGECGWTQTSELQACLGGS